MSLRYLMATGLMAILLIVNGCDPQDVIKQKVPEPLKEAMSDGKDAPRSGEGGSGESQEKVSIEIVTPKRNSVYPAGEKISFEAKTTIPEAKDVKKATVVWMLYRDTAKKGVQIGRGDLIKKTLEAGKYRVSATLLIRDRKTVKTSTFRVANTVAGKITADDGVPLAGTKVVISEMGGDEPKHTARSGKDGTFSVEIPEEGYYRLMPKKEGYSFLPYSRIVKYTNPPVRQSFKGTKAQITDITFTEDAEGEASLDSVCPLQQSYLSFAVKSDVKPKSVRVYLVSVEDGKERIIQMDDASETESLKQKLDPNGTVLKLQVPSMMAMGPTETSYRLRLTVVDEKGRQFSEEAPESFAYNIVKCFRRALADGVAQQNKGEYEHAVRSYKLMETLNKKVHDPTPFVTFMDQSVFNRGLAFLALAMKEKKDSIEQQSMLKRAKDDFDRVLEEDKSDLDAKLFLGVTFQLAGAYRRAEKYYDSVIQQEPRYPGVRELRAQVKLKLVEADLKQMRKAFRVASEEGMRELLGRLMQAGKLKPQERAVLKRGSSNLIERVNVLLKIIKRHQEETERMLLSVVDDYTEGIEANPNDESLRASRREALKIVYDLQESEVDVATFRDNLRKLLKKESVPDHMDHPALQVPVSKIPSRDAKAVANLDKFIRK